MSVKALVLRRAILEWRDDCLFEADLALSRSVHELQLVIADKLKEAGLWQMTALPARYCETFIEPLVTGRIAAVTQAQQQRAIQALRQLHDSTPEFVSETPRLRATAGTIWNILDVASAGAPLALGAWTIAALPAISITSVSVLLGLSTAAVVSTPVLVGGAALAAAGGAVGITRLTGLRSRMAARLEARLNQGLTLAVLGNDENPDTSILGQFSAAIEDIARTTLRELDDDPATDPV